MGYEAALQKAWQELGAVAPEKAYSVRFLADEYAIDPGAATVMSEACNVPAKDFTAILVLHYLAKKLKGLPPATGTWMAFKELSGIEGYALAFRNRSIVPVLRKYGKNPDALALLDRGFIVEKTHEADAGIVIQAFEGVPVKVLLWRGDDEFGPEAGMLFDKSITQIFCTEDIVVLAGMVAAAL